MTKSLYGLPTEDLEYEADKEAMRKRHEELGWEFNEDEFNWWYNDSKYAAKVVCEKLRRSRMG